MIRKQENFWKTDRRVLGKVFETEVHLIKQFNQVSWTSMNLVTFTCHLAKIVLAHQSKVSLIGVQNESSKVAFI